MPSYRTVAPTVEPITLAEVKSHIRQDASVGSIEDAMLTRWIKSAREQAENLTQRYFVEQTWRLELDAFPAAIELPRGPVLSVQSVKYQDASNVQQTLDPADYTVDKNGRYTSYIVPAYGKTWPTTYPHINSVLVEWKAGYGTDATSVPECVKDWMLLTIEDRYNNRGASVDIDIKPNPFLDAILGPVHWIRV